MLAPSIVSVDACLTDAAAVRREGRVHYLGHVVPREVVVDFDLICKAPPELNRAGAGDILSFAKKVRGAYDTVCLVGIGGSALGAWALDCGLRGPHPVQAAFSPANPRLVILDNVDPALVDAALASMNPKKTLVVVIAKSGSTAETVSTFLIVREWLQKALGRKAAKRIVARSTGPS